MAYRSVAASDDQLLLPRFNTNHIHDYLLTGHIKF